MEKTSKTINAVIESFQNMVAYLLTQGFTVDRAVEEAYKLYPVMDSMHDVLLDELVTAFSNGYAMVGVAEKIPYTSEAISHAMSRAWSSDTLTLSKRLHKRNGTVKREVGAVLKGAIGKGKANRAIAEDIFSGYGVGKHKQSRMPGRLLDESELPKFMKAVATIRLGDGTPEEEEKKRKLLRRIKFHVSKRTTAGMRAAYTELMGAIETDNAHKLTKAIYVATQEKTRYLASRIARTEVARAYADGQMARYMGDEDIVAFQWKLGSRHPVFDICDFYANADLYGLGKGVYPKDKFPTMPAHPHCMCRIKPIVQGQLQDTKEREDIIEEGGLALLRKLPKGEQEKLLGVHGRKAVLSGNDSWQDHMRGWSNEYFVLRKPKMDTLHQPVTKGDRYSIKPVKKTIQTEPYVVDRKMLRKVMRKHVNQLPVDDALKVPIYREIMECFNATNGKNMERAGIIDRHTKKTVYSKKGEEHSGSVPILTSVWENQKKNSLILIHNHPNNTGFSRGDIRLFLKREEVHCGIVCTGDGKLFYVGNFKGNRKELAKMFETLYNESVEKNGEYDVLTSVIDSLKSMQEKGVLKYVARKKD